MKNIFFTLLSFLSIVFASEVNANIPSWTVNPADFAYSMNGFLRVKMDSVFYPLPVRIGVFYGNECRGIVSVGKIFGGVVCYPITIYSNSKSNEVLTFKVYEVANDVIYNADEVTTFLRSSIFAMVGSPLILTIHPSCTRPIFTFCPPNVVISNAFGLCGSTYTYTPTVSGFPTPTYSYTFTGATTGNGIGTGSGSFFNKGITTVHVVASSSCNPSDHCSFTVEVVDGPIKNMRNNLHYCAISDAIQATETQNGDTLQIDAGTYTGACTTLDKTLWLKALGGDVTFNCLVMNGASKNLTLNGNFTITNLTLTNGKIHTNGNNLKCGTITGGSAASYVITD